jgi:Tfp pilus assembly protein PilO
MNHDERWRLDRSVSVGDLLVFLSLLFAGLGYVIHQDGRMTKAETKVEGLEKTDNEIKAEARAGREEIRSDLRALNEKMDRLLRERR